MEITQIYAFRDVQSFNVFMQENYREFVSHEIRIVPVVSGDVALLMHYLIAEVKWMMCKEIWERYEKIVGEA
jgi:hypothetical protein